MKRLHSIGELFRRSLSQFMVERHRISPELADYHVRQVGDRRVAEEWLLYLRQGVGVEVGSRALEIRPTAGRNARDGETTAPKRAGDSGAFPLRGRRGWVGSSVARKVAALPPNAYSARQEFLGRPSNH